VVKAGIDPPITPDMRQLGHIAVGVAFWTLLIVLWVLLVI
jgi:hypothetical protein